jgi:hypothetical protein
VARTPHGVRATAILVPMTSVLDDALPGWHYRERHRVPATAAADVTLAGFEALCWREVPLFRVLMAIRTLGRTSRAGGRPILDDFTSIGFTEISRTATELVYAGIGRPWSVRGGMRTVQSLDSFRGFSEPGWAKMAVNFQLTNGDFSTETRVLLTNRAAHRAFGTYWLVIRPFSGLIRRSWLHATTRRVAGYPQGEDSSGSPR